MLFIYIAMCIFKTGLVHCDLHAGNILFLNGALWILAWGCTVSLSEKQQKAFQQIYLHLAEYKTRKSQESARAIATAVRDLGFATEKNTEEGLAQIALDAFDST